LPGAQRIALIQPVALLEIDTGPGWTKLPPMASLHKQLKAVAGSTRSTNILLAESYSWSRIVPIDSEVLERCTRRGYRIAS
jgi:hypothetical protein